MMTKKQAGILLLILSAATIVFHLLVLIGVIPYTVVWGGKIETLEQRYIFEGISLAVNVLLIGTVLQESGYINRFLPKKAIRIILWFFVVVFALNTLGNLFAENRYEQTIGSLLTFSASFLCWRLVTSQGATCRTKTGI